MIVVENKKELKELIKQRIHEQGLSCDLNDIDVSRVEDMSDLFIDSAFNGDISGWDVSSVIDMWNMFADSKFNGDLSNWNVDMKKVQYAFDMFKGSPLEGNEPSWYIDK